jgi:hypothetical protein
MSDTSAAMRSPYEIVSIGRANPPPGAEDSEWCEYVITQGGNTIHGSRQGTLVAVTTAVEEIVIRLNERRLHKRGRTHIVMKSSRSAIKS